MKCSKILIVGGSGYLGRYFYQYIKDKTGTSVFVTGSKKTDEDNYFQIDFDKPSSFDSIKNEKFDILLIFASKLNALGTLDLTHPDLYTNTLGYSSFLQYVHNNGIGKKIIYTSSMTVYDPKNTAPVFETGEINPVHIYGLSKSIAESITIFFCIQNNIPGVIFRLPGIYGGDRKDGFIYNTIKRIQANEKIELQTKGLIYWETIHIEDLCEMFFSFLQTYTWEKLNAVYNICYGCETDIVETTRFIKSEISNSQSIIINEETKGYIPFYLSNTKLSRLIPVKTQYFERLRKYIKEEFPCNL